MCAGHSNHQRAGFGIYGYGLIISMSNGVNGLSVPLDQGQDWDQIRQCSSGPVIWTVDNGHRGRDVLRYIVREEN